MRRFCLSLISALCVTALLVACTDQPAPTESSVLDAPTLDWMNNPDNGNLNIFRAEFHWRVCWTDASNGLRVCHTTVPFGPDPQTACDIQGEGDPVAYQDVGLWGGDFFHAVAHGTTWVVVRDMNAEGDCFGRALVAEGWGNFGYNDNDISGSTDPNANTWMFRGQGRLEATDGSKVHYNGVRHLQFGPNIPFRILKSKVNVR